MGTWLNDTYTNSPTAAALAITKSTNKTS